MERTKGPWTALQSENHMRSFFLCQCKVLVELPWSSLPSLTLWLLLPFTRMTNFLVGNITSPKLRSIATRTSCSALRCMVGGLYPTSLDIERAIFWRKLTNMNVFAHDLSPKCIKSGAWKYPHRWIATTNIRQNLGNTVTCDDPDILIFISKGHQIDVFSLLTERPIEWENPTCLNTAKKDATS